MSSYPMLTFIRVSVGRITSDDWFSGSYGTLLAFVIETEIQNWSTSDKT